MSHPDDDITMRECLMRDIQDLTAQRNELQADRAHLLTIARSRLEKIRQLEREIEACAPLKSQISNLQIP
jgi:predicted XRE-type DNA-binding protein